jgi:hypothetical protein
MNKVNDLRRQDKKGFDPVQWVEVALEILGVDGVTVALVDIPKLNTGDTTFYGITEKLPIKDTYRLCLLDTATTSTKKTVICHECIHIKQYHDGRLSIKDKTTLVFDGKEYHPPYDKKQPHEKEAWGGQNKLKRQVNEKIGKLQHR